MNHLPADPPARAWRLAPAFSLTLDRPRVMAILNITPDSFSDGGEIASPADAAQRATEAIDAGADLLDIGGESTRPGSERVGVDEQIRRVVPAIEAIRSTHAAVPITIDTTRARVARAALDAGATAINDVSGATEDTAMLPLAADRACGIVLMHRLTTPELDSYSDQYQHAPTYHDGVVGEVRAALGSMLSRAVEAGIDHQAVVLDPGLGFGKSVEQNLTLLRKTPELLSLGAPILSALSRKSFVGSVSVSDPSKERPEPRDRLPGTLALSALHLWLGARVFRVHDVAPARGALDASWALLTQDRTPADERSYAC